MIGWRRWRAAVAILAAFVLTVVAAGCGGGGGDSTSAAAVVAQVEEGCERVSGTAVWLPEHLAKTGKSSDEGQAIVEDAAAEYDDLLEGLDPPAELDAPIRRLIDFPFVAEPTSRAAFRATEERLVGIYRELGAEGCRKQVEASILTFFDGLSVEAAYRHVKAPLPAHPPGW